MYSCCTRTCVSGKENASARSSRVLKIPCVDSHTVSRPPSHSATALCGSRAQWSCVGVRYSREITTAADLMARAASPRVMM